MTMCNVRAVANNDKPTENYLLCILASFSSFLFFILPSIKPEIHQQYNLPGTKQ